MARNLETCFVQFVIRFDSIRFAEISGEQFESASDKQNVNQQRIRLIANSYAAVAAAAVAPMLCLLCGTVLIEIFVFIRRASSICNSQIVI